MNSLGLRTSISGLPGLDMGQDVVAERPDRGLVPAGDRILRGRIVGDFGGHRPALVDPELAAAVHDLAVLVSEQRERPERVAGPPVRLVAVEDHGRVRGDPVSGAELGELLRG